MIPTALAHGWISQGQDHHHEQCMQSRSHNSFVRRPHHLMRTVPDKSCPRPLVDPEHHILEL